jgi:hypothetical protein
MLPVVAAMAGGTQAGITDAQMKQMTAYLEKLQAGGSVNLQKDLTELLSTFKNRGFLPELKLIQQ